MKTQGRPTLMGSIAIAKKIKAELPKLIQPSRQDYAMIELLISHTALAQALEAMLFAVCPDANTAQLEPHFVEPIKQAARALSMLTPRKK